MTSENPGFRLAALELYIPAFLTVSVFLPYYFTVLAVLATAVTILAHRGLREHAFRTSGSRRLVAFLFIPFYAAVFHENLRGMMYAVLILAATVCALSIKASMTRRIYESLLDLSCACSVACAGIAVAQKIAMWSSEPLFRPMSMFMNANYYGAMTVFMILVGLHRFFNRSKNRWVYGVTVLCNLVGLYLCASMSSLATMAFSVFILLLLERRRRLAAILALLVCAGGILVLLVPELYPRIDNVDVTFGNRLAIWKTAIKGILQYPLLGRGAEAYPLVCAQFGGYHTYHCHNLLLDLLLNFGVLGTGGVAAFGVYKVRQMYLRYKKNICREYTILAASVLTAVLVHGITDVTIFWIQTGMFFFILFSSMGIEASHSERKLYRRVAGVLLPPSVPEGRLRTEYMKR